MNQVILNVATATRHYQKSQKRLVASLDRFNEWPRLILSDIPEGCPTHDEAPWGFKPHLFCQARDEGYTHALWLDATIVLHKPLDLIWEMIDRDGAFFWNSGWTTGQWTSDACLDGMGYTREAAWKIPMVQASAIGLKFDSDRNFLDKWKTACDDGLFLGSGTNKNHEISHDPGVDGHRHDQSVASLLAHELGFPLTDPPLCLYANPTEETIIQNKGPG